MRKTGWIIAAAVAGLLTAGGVPRVFAGDKASLPALATTPVVKHQTTCPVMGGAVDKKYFADYQGKRVYFCCKACPAMFKKDPAKYIKQLESAGTTLDKTPLATTTNAPAAASPREP